MMFKLMLKPFRILISLGIFTTLVLNIACEKQQSDNTHQINQNTKSENQTPKQRTVKYFDLSYLKMKPPKDSDSNVSKEQALSIADEVFSKEYGKNDSGDVVVCENGLGWWVIYEETGDEYSISKNNLSNNYEIIKKRTKKFSLSSNNQTDSETITKEEGFVIAQERVKLLFERINNLSAENPISDSEKKKIEKKIFNDNIPAACELKTAWRIYYIPRSALEGAYPNDGMPDYLIDKKTGTVLYDSRKGWGIINDAP